MPFYSDFSNCLILLLSWVSWIMFKTQHNRVSVIQMRFCFDVNYSTTAKCTFSTIAMMNMNYCSNTHYSLTHWWHYPSYSTCIFSLIESRGMTEWRGKLEKVINKTVKYDHICICNLLYTQCLYIHSLSCI